MWLSDFEEAIAAIKEQFGDGCWTKITASLFGDSFIFTDTSGRTIKYLRHTGAIIETFEDTWRNPEHYTVIKSGII